jgi:hypothetical protein
MGGGAAMRVLSAPKGVILAPNGRPAVEMAMENNWYEGSRWSPNRSFIWFPVQDAKKDLDRYTRTELMKHARYLYKNSPLIRGLIERIVTLVVGSGFYPVFKSSNPDWNKRAKALWKRKSRNIHLGPRCSMLQYQRCVARARFLDGEAFSVKTSDETISFEDRIQGVEADRVGGVKGKDINPYNAENVKGYIVDGFNLNAQGVVTSYNFRGIDKPYEAQYIVHHFTPERLGQYRGVTILSAAINTARDVDDILALEKDAVKEASSHKDIIKTSSGQIDAETFRQLRYGTGDTGQFPTVFNLPADANAKNDYYKIQFGGQPIVLKKGDEYDSYKPDRPGSAWQGFMDFLSGTTVASTGFPASVVLPINIGGTDIRRDLDIAQKVCDPFQLDIVAELDELLDYLLQGDIADGELRKDLPDDWMIRGWQMPPKVNVDRQQAQQDREDVSHGLMSREEFHGRYGEDSLEIDTTVIAEAKRRKADIQGAGFSDTKEFVEIISLDPKMFVTRSQDDEQLATGKTPPVAKPAPGKKGAKKKVNA